MAGALLGSALCKTRPTLRRARRSTRPARP